MIVALSAFISPAIKADDTQNNFHHEVHEEHEEEQKNVVGFSSGPSWSNLFFTLSIF